MQQGNLPLAKEKLERAEKQDPDELRGAHGRWRSCYERLGRTQDAERHYQTALRLAPDSAEIANNYAVFLCSTGKVERRSSCSKPAAKNQLVSHALGGRHQCRRLPALRQAQRGRGSAFRARA